MFLTVDPGSNAAWIGTALLVLIGAWRGWKMGVVRQAAALVALVGAGAAGVLGGAAVAPWLEGVPQIPAEARVAVGGLILGVVVYLAVTLFSVVIFKKTEHQSIGVIRFGYGVAGALLGALVGLIFAAAIGTGFLLATGRQDVVEEWRRRALEKALDSTPARPENAPTKPHHPVPR